MAGVKKRGEMAALRSNGVSGSQARRRGWAAQRIEKVDNRVRCVKSKAAGNGPPEEDLSEVAKQHAEGDITPESMKQVMQREASEDLHSSDPAKGEAVKEAIGQIHNMKQAESEQMQQAFELLQSQTNIAEALGMDLRGPRDVESDPQNGTGLTE